MPGGENSFRSAADLAEAVADLAGVDLLGEVPKRELEDLARELRPVWAPAGEALIRPGTVAQSFLLVTAGTVAVAVGEGAARRTFPVRAGSILGEIALLRGVRHAAAATAVTEVRALMGGLGAFARMLALPGVEDRVVTRARQRVAADLKPVPVLLRDGTSIGLRPVLPDDRRRLLQARDIASAETIYLRFFTVNQPTAETARMLTEVDYLDHFAWVAVADGGDAVGGVSYVRSPEEPDEADISFSIIDGFQGRGLGTLFMAAIAVAGRHNGVARFTADVLAENLPMRAILARAGMRWHNHEYGVVHGVMDVPDPGLMGMDETTAAELAAHVAEVCLRGSQMPLVVPAQAPAGEQPAR